MLVALGGTLPCALILTAPASAADTLTIAPAEPAPQVLEDISSSDPATLRPDPAVLSAIAQPDAALRQAKGGEVTTTRLMLEDVKPAASKVSIPSTPKAGTKPARTQPKTLQKPAQSTPKKTAAERVQKLVAADRLYRQGQKSQAEALYRQVKAPFAKTSFGKPATPILDVKQLPPAGQVYWREAQAGRVIVPLNLLVKQYPQFIPGHLRLAAAHRAVGHEKKALAVLEQASAQYPAQPNLLKATIAAQGESQQWLEASIAARQFVLLNPSHPEAPAFSRLADQNLRRFRAKLRGKLRGNAIANALTGILGFALTGSPLGSVASIQTATLLLRGETAVGNSLAKRAKRQLKLVKDPEVTAYVNELGQKLAATIGRSDFKYEFYIVKDDKLNAFALPGGKVFINAGAIIKTRSEAELAGLIAHELSHAALSHSFQLATEGNAIAGVAQFVPFGGLITNLAVLDYSRDMERQADILATRVLATADYAADGLRNLMVTLDQEDKDIPFTWLSSHPVTDKRVRYLEALIERNGYRRYAYEGVERHGAIKAKVTRLLAASEKK